MKKNIILIAALILRFSSSSQTSSAIQSLVDAEKGFAAMSLAKGIKAAFVAHLADNAIIFRPGPINGKEYWLKREPSKAILEWRPVFADVAQSGELGYTIGPSVFTPSPDVDQPPTYGHFVSIWRKSTYGEWKVELDAGISHPALLTHDTTLVLAEQVKTKSAPIQHSDRSPVLLQLERLFSTLSSKKGSVTAYSRYLASDARVFREGRPPAVGFDSSLALIRSLNEIMTWTPIASHVAGSLDLGYTYGTFQSITEKGHYVHIWKKQPSGAMKVVVDLLLPLPPE